MPPTEAEQSEVLGNYRAFMAELPALLERAHGRYAVYRHRHLVEIFDKFPEALVYCGKAFSDRQFSIQEITAEPLDLGWFVNASGAVSVRPSSGAAH